MSSPDLWEEIARIQKAQREKEEAERTRLQYETQRKYEAEASK